MAGDEPPAPLVACRAFGGLLGHRAVRTALVAFVFLAVASLTAAGCSSPSPPSLDGRVAGTYESVYLGRLEVCYGVATPLDESTLEAREVEACVLAGGALGSTVDGTFWSECASTASNECQSYECELPAGTRAAGEPCLAANQCASLACIGTAIDGPDGDPLPKALRCGTCAPLLADGAACDPTKDACAETSTCFGGVCRPQGGEGAACATLFDCQVPDFVCTSRGVCGVVTADGAPCGSSGDCATASACEVTTHVCEPVVYAQPGMPCDGEVGRCMSRVRATWRRGRMSGGAARTACLAIRGISRTRATSRRTASVARASSPIPTRAAETSLRTCCGACSDLTPRARPCSALPFPRAFGRDSASLADPCCAAMKQDATRFFVCPKCHGDLAVEGAHAADGEIESGALRCAACPSSYAVRAGVPRFAGDEQYADTFGRQWNRWDNTQHDSQNGTTIYTDRMRAYTGWTPESMKGKVVVEAGCGPGAYLDVAERFADAAIGFDLSTAIDAAYRLHGKRPNVYLAQADIFNPPVRPGVADRLYTFGVVQHTPDPERAYRSLIPLVKPGGEIAVWVYRRSRIPQPSYWLRRYTRGMEEPRATQFIEWWVPKAMVLSGAIGRIPRVGKWLRRAVPVADYRGRLDLTEEQYAEWALMDGHTRHADHALHVPSALERSQALDARPRGGAQAEPAGDVRGRPASAQALTERRAASWLICIRSWARSARRSSQS